MTDDLKQSAKGALKALDGFMSGAEVTAEQKDLESKVTIAGSFAAAAYDHHLPKGGGEYHALTRAFLLALIDPLHPDLDYLRSDPMAGKVLRDERAPAGGKVI